MYVAELLVPHSYACVNSNLCMPLKKPFLFDLIAFEMVTNWASLFSLPYALACVSIHSMGYDFN